ncbi:MAG: polysaccharide deacetylase family protein, partial [Planctomycetota bacterium]
MPLKSAFRRLRLCARRGPAKRHRESLIKQRKLPGTVVFYHRVADEHPNDWTIGCRQFTKQMRWLKEHTECVDLATIQRHVKQGSARRLTSVTFDDGYSDNGTWALPLLQQLQIPCTYFVSTEHVRTGLPFQHDLAAGARLPVHTPEDVKRWADRGIEIGCHTRNHVDFSKIEDPRLIDEEVAVAKDELERMIGGPVRYFAVPFGLPEQLTPVLVDAIRRAGFQGFTSAYGDYNDVGGNEFHIKRVHGDSDWS